MNRFTTSDHLARITVDGVASAGRYVLDQLPQLGVTVPHTSRLHKAIRRVERGIPQTIDVASMAPLAEDYRLVIESYLITTALLRRPDFTHDGTLSSLVSGDPSPESTNTHARDTQFELLIASLLLHGRVAGVTLGEPDIRIPAGDDFVGLAVKRLSSTNPSRIARRLREAVNQIRRSAQPGLIVLNIDRYVDSNRLADPGRSVHDAILRQRELLKGLKAEDVVIGVFGFATPAVWTMMDNKLTLAGLSFQSALQLIIDDTPYSATAIDTLRTVGTNILASLSQDLLLLG